MVIGRTGYISWHKVSPLPILPLALHTSVKIRGGRATTTQHTHHQVSLMVLCYTTLVPSLALRVGSACEADLSTGMRRERVPPQKRKKERKKGRRSSHGGVCFRADTLSPLIQMAPLHTRLKCACVLPKNYRLIASVTTRLRRTIPFPRPVLRTKILFIYKCWPTSLPINKVTPSYSTSHIPPILFVLALFVCLFVCLLFLSVIQMLYLTAIRPRASRMLIN